MAASTTADDGYREAIRTPDLITGNILPGHCWTIGASVAVFPVVVKRAYLSHRFPRDPFNEEYEYERAQQMIDTEQKAYERLKGCPGVLEYVQSVGSALFLPLLEKGDLHQYLKKHPDTDFAQRISWIKQMTQTLVQIHHRNLIIGDIATRNMLLNRDLTLSFCDFGLSDLLPEDADIWTTPPTPFSYQSDIGELGACIYEVVTGKMIRFELCDNKDEEFTWPDRDRLPSTDGIFMGKLIEACWTRDLFRQTAELSELTDALLLEKYGPSELDPTVDKRTLPARLLEVVSSAMPAEVTIRASTAAIIASSAIVACGLLKRFM